MSERDDKNDEPLTIDDVKKMSQSEINSRWDEVQVVLREQGTESKPAEDAS